QVRRAAGQGGDPAGRGTRVHDAARDLDRPDRAGPAEQPGGVDGDGVAGLRVPDLQGPGVDRRRAAEGVVVFQVQRAGAGLDQAAAVEGQGEAVQVDRGAGRGDGERVDHRAGSQGLVRTQLDVVRGA